MCDIIICVTGRVALMEVFQYFHDNLLEAIEGTLYQSSSTDRKCTSSQYVLVLI